MFLFRKIPGTNNFPKDEIDLVNDFKIYSAFDNEDARRKTRDEKQKK